MNTLGIRTKPHEATIAVFDCERDRIVNVEAIKIPKALSTPEGLKYLRNTILDVVREYKILKAGIRVTESNAQRLNIQRIESEGVIQEAFSSSDLKSYFRGQISNISSRLNLERTRFKPLIEGTDQFGQIENWAEFSEVEREAILTAIAASHD